MTYREKLMQEHPDCVNEKIYVGGCKGCPSRYGYESLSDSPHVCIGEDINQTCRECWGREMEDTDEY